MVLKASPIVRCWANENIGPGISGASWALLGRAGGLLKSKAGAVPKHVKRNKNDAADAEAICEATLDAFCAVKSIEQQGMLMLHRSRELLIRQPTMLIKALRRHLADTASSWPKGDRTPRS